VRNAYRTIGRVHALPAGTGGPEHVDLEVVGVDGDVDLLGLGQHGHCRRGSVDAALRLGGGHPLHPVDPRLSSQAPERVPPPYREDDLADATKRGAALRNQLDAQPVALAIAGVHPVKIGRKKGRLVAASARPDLDNRVAVVERISRDQEFVQFRPGGLHLGWEPLEIDPGQCHKLGIGLLRHFPSLRKFVFQTPKPFRRPHDRYEPGVFPSEGR
jgi:hypothetical protein